MAKDPAVLWYTSDFYLGTMFFTDEQVGKYTRLLVMQHQQGHLSEQDMLKICKRYDEKIFEKFKKDKEGKYYNERMETEIIKRRDYSESRKKNRENKKDMTNISETYVNHMVNVNENIDINKEEDGIKKLFVKRWSRNYKNLSELQGAEKLVLEFGYDKVNNAFRIAGENDKTTIPYVRGILNKGSKENKSDSRFGSSEIMNKLYGDKDGH
jgi:hypothetical protein